MNKQALILKLRMHADKIGMTELSKRCGISQSNLYSVLDYKTNATIESIIKVANGLGFYLDLVEIKNYSQV